MPKEERPPEDRLVFPSALRHARKAAGFRTQGAFAKACSVDPETVGRYERGHLPPSEHTVRHMIEELRRAEPHANFAALKQAAEQDRRTWDTWDVEPIAAPADSPELLPPSRPDPSRPDDKTTDHAQVEQLLEQLRRHPQRVGMVFVPPPPPLPPPPPPLPPPSDSGSGTRQEWYRASSSIHKAFNSLWMDRSTVRVGEVTLNALHAMWSQQEPHCSPMLVGRVTREEASLSPHMVQEMYDMMQELDVARWLRDNPR